MMTMRSFAVTAALVCACAWPAPRAGANPAAVPVAPPTLGARAAIQAAYDKQDAAYVRKDAAGIAATYAPGFRVVDQRTGEEQNEAQALDLGFTFAMCRPVSAQTTILNITVQGRTAVVTRKSHGVLLMMGTPKAQPTRLVGDTLSVDTWVNSGSGWLQQRMKVTGGGLGFDINALAPQAISGKG